MEVLERAWSGLRAPVEQLIDPSARLFLPFALGSVVLGAAVLVVTARREGQAASVGGALRALFSRRVWLGRSARVDYALFALNAAWKAALLPGLAWSIAATSALVTTTLRLALGPPLDLTPPPLALTLGYTLALFLASDLSRYLLHRLMHRVPRLWALHQVHHAAERLNPVTLHRVHPVESLLFTLRGVVAIGGVTGVFVWAFGPSLSGLEVLGVNALGFAFNAAGANLRHSHVWLSWGRALEHVFLSPAQHQLHHSRARRHHDKNFGSFLALWDWAFGTLVTEARPRRLRFGLDEAERGHAPTLRSSLIDPLRGRTGGRTGG